MPLRLKPQATQEETEQRYSWRIISEFRYVEDHTSLQVKSSKYVVAIVHATNLFLNEM